MTIKELCMNCDCIHCPFKNACYKLECTNPEKIPDGFNEPITTSIIETAKMLAPTKYWIKHTNNGIEYIECPDCSIWYMKSHLTRNSYCPNCGARMRWK